MRSIEEIRKDVATIIGQVVLSENVYEAKSYIAEAVQEDQIFNSDNPCEVWDIVFNAEQRKDKERILLKTHGYTVKYVENEFGRFFVILDTNIPETLIHYSQK